MPVRTQAALPVIDAPNKAINTLTYITNTLTEVSVIAQQALQYLFYVKEYVLEPIAFIQSGKAIQALTGGMLAFVAGDSNGTGQSQFIGNIPGHFRSVQDNASQAFLRQLRASRGSPYAAVVASSLEADYLEGSSLAGFFAANRSTLPQYSANPEAFLAGDWSQGGIGAWIALATRPENNPYMYYHAARETHAKLIFAAQETHQEMLAWGQGFLSWCGALDEPLEDGAACDAGGYPGTWTDGICMQDEASDAAPAEAITPGTPCAKEDGTPGIVQTPGTTISKYLDKALSLDADKVAKMGNAASQITSLAATLMETVQMAQVVIGGPQGGLAGVGRPRPSGRSLVDEYRSPTTPYAGVNQCSINQTLLDSPPSNGSELLARLDEYVESWAAVAGVAEAAAASVGDVGRVCRANAEAARRASGRPGDRARFIEIATRYADEAETAYATYVTPALERSRDAVEVAAEAEAAVEALQTKLSSPGAEDPLVCEDLSVEIEAVRVLPPTVSDLAYIRRESISTGYASTSPEGSLVLAEVSRSSIVDELEELDRNARRMLAYCERMP